jgi:tetratricopeptide (TPR) repeat protein
MTRTSSLVAVLCVLGVSSLPAQQIPIPLPLKLVEESAARDSNDASAQYYIALARWNQKRYDDAERALRLAMMLDPKYAEPHLALAFLPYSRRPKLWKEDGDRVPEEWKTRIEESEREFRRAFFINPFVDLRIIGAITPRDQGMWRFEYPDVYKLFVKPYDDVFSGRYADAYHGFVQLEQNWGFTMRGPLPRDVYWFKTLCAARIGKITEAMRSMDKLLEEQERYEHRNRDKLIRRELRTNDYRYIKAILLQAHGEKEAALALFRAVLERDIGLYMAHVRMATLYEEDKKWAEAIAERQNAVNANPDDAGLLIDLGVTAGKAGEFEVAMEALSRAAEANPRLADAPFWTGMLHYSQGNHEEARKAFTTFLAIAPSRWHGKIDSVRKLLEGMP